jgi:hypothetical protein
VGHFLATVSERNKNMRGLIYELLRAERTFVSLLLCVRWRREKRLLAFFSQAF